MQQRLVEDVFCSACKKKRAGTVRSGPGNVCPLSAALNDDGASTHSDASSARKRAHTPRDAEERPPPEAEHKPPAEPPPPARERRPAERRRRVIAGPRRAAAQELQSPPAATEAAAATGNRCGHPRRPATPSLFRAELLKGPLSFSYAKRDAETTHGFQTCGIECFYEGLTVVRRRTAADPSPARAADSIRLRSSELDWRRAHYAKKPAHVS